MNHLREQELILHFYREGAKQQAAEEHLDSCPFCRERLADARGADRADQGWRDLPLPSG